MAKPLYRKPGETERSFQLRRFKWEGERMSDCEVLQDMRRVDGCRSAVFWQLEARSAYIRMQAARAAIARIDIETIPGTACGWDEIFPGKTPARAAWDKLKLSIEFGIGAISHGSITGRAMKLAGSSAYGKSERIKGKRETIVVDLTEIRRELEQRLNQTP